MLKMIQPRNQTTKLTSNIRSDSGLIHFPAGRIAEPVESLRAEFRYRSLLPCPCARELSSFRIRSWQRRGSMLRLHETLLVPRFRYCSPTMTGAGLVAPALCTGPLHRYSKRLGNPQQPASVNWRGIVKTIAERVNVFGIRLTYFGDRHLVIERPEVPRLTDIQMWKRRR